MDQINSEELHETLLQLEGIKENEYKLKYQFQSVLDGLSVLTENLSPKSTFLNLIQLLQEQIPFEHAFLTVLQGNETKTSFASRDEFYQFEMDPENMKNRIQHSKAYMIFDCDQVPEWQGQDQAIRAITKSALQVPLKTTAEGAMLICTHSQKAFFNREHVRLIERFSFLMSQALQNAEFKNLLQEEQKKLQISLEEITQLKNQQDGDYFLTHLLLTPFPFETIKSDNGQIELQSYLEQKKKFQFRDKRREIGGDLNMAEIIHLKGREYSFFMNADAMGKSIQGAGGILVLGSIMRSVLNRTISTQEGKKVYPERWLKNVFTILQDAFTGFNGSMLISLVTGLIDNETGLLYYLNAEHPWTTLLRDGKASFIEDELILRKIGTEGIKSLVQVKTFQLKPGDMLFSGSDGRDDLLLEIKDGNRVINEDEKLFLEVLEESKGDLLTCRNLLAEIGELTDDLSLLKVHFVESDENQKAEAKRNQSIAELSKYKDALAKQDDETAIELLEKYIELAPDDSKAIYEASCVYTRLNDYDKAIDYGERVRLRTPNDIPNLVNLAESYHLHGIKKNAMAILDIASKLDAENEDVKALQQRVH